MNELPRGKPMSPQGLAQQDPTRRNSQPDGPGTRGDAACARQTDLAKVKRRRRRIRVQARRRRFAQPALGEIDENSSLAEAIEANYFQTAVLGQDPGPYSPIHQWSALRDIQDLKEKYERGDRGALIDVAKHVAHHGLRFPEWARTPFVHAWREVAHYRVSSWDDVFGRKIPKGRHRSRMEKEFRLAFQIYSEITGMREKDKKSAPLSDDLFEQVGRRFGVAKTVCRELFEHARNQWKEPPLP